MTEKLLLVSADGHAGGPPELYFDYIEQKYLPDLQELVAADDKWQQTTITQLGFGDEVLDLIDRGDAIRSGGARGGWDFDRRLTEQDREGVAAEVLLPGPQDSVPLFFHGMNTPFSPDLRAAGARAYHRHLADGMAASGGRLVGIADPTPCIDLDETVKELQWAAEHCFVGVQPPGATYDPDLSLPPVSNQYYEPFWAACEDLGLVLTIHAGYGSPQSGDVAAKMMEMLGDVSPEQKLQMIMETSIDQFPEDSPARLAITTPRRVLWQLILGGVFDRHPSLKLVFTEVRADWVSDLLAWLDRKFQENPPGVKLSPSEYWERHCYAAPSSPRPYEVAMRENIGVDRFMFGMDFPHPEGTWPNTREWLRSAFAGVSEHDLRRIGGLNAVDCYGLDLAALTKVTDRIGMTTDEVLSGKPVDERLVEQFHKRSGYSRAPEVFDPTFYQDLFSADEALLASS